MTETDYHDAIQVFLHREHFLNTGLYETEYCILSFEPFMLEVPQNIDDVSFEKFIPYIYRIIHVIGL